MLAEQKVRQIAYAVADVRAAATRHSQLFGSGPFFIAERVPTRSCTYRGQSGDFDHTAAFGQWGELMVEFIQQNNPGPTIISDMYPLGSGKEGIHHVAFIVEDPRAMVGAAVGRGFEMAMHIVQENGVEAFFVDTTALCGHMVEYYAPSPGVLRIYNFVREQALDFDGQRIIRQLPS